MDEVAEYPVSSDQPLHPAPSLVDHQRRGTAGRVTIWNGMHPWLFTRYDHVREVLNDPRTSADSTHPGYPSTSRAIEVARNDFPTFLQLDAPEHGRLRRLVAGYFTASQGAKARSVIEEIVDRAVHRLLGLTPPVDFVEEFALRVAWEMTAVMLGVPQRDHELFQACAHTLASGASSNEEVLKGSRVMFEYLDRLLAEKEAEPGDDVLSGLVQRVSSGDMTREQSIGTARLLLTGGHTSTASMISLGMLALFAHPAEAAKLRADPSLLPNAVEELLRFLTVAHIGRRRVASEDLEVAGQIVRKGDGIIADHRLANRDPDKFAEPNQLSVERDTSGHLAFGAGPHQCLGQHLARVRLQVVFDRLLRVDPALRLSGSVDDALWKDFRIITMGLDRLMVTW